MMKKAIAILCMSIIFSTLTFPVNAKITSVNHWGYSNFMQLQAKNILDQQKLYNLDDLVSRAEATSIFSNLVTGEDGYEKTKIYAKDIHTTFPYYKELQKLVSRNVIYNAQYFRPNDYLTRAEAAKMLVYAFDFKEVRNSSKIFTDVPKTHWAHSSIMSLAQLKITAGQAGGKFNPNGHVTIAELSSLIVSTMNVANKIAEKEFAYNFLAKEYIETKNFYPAFEDELIRLINEQRNQYALEPLKKDLGLTQLAIIKTKDMIERNYFDHYSPTYQMPWELAGLFDYDFVTIGENLARNYTDAKDAVDAWMMSPTHKANVINPAYKYIGIGIRQDKQGYYYLCNLFSGK